MNAEASPKNLTRRDGRAMAYSATMLSLLVPPLPVRPLFPRLHRRLHSNASFDSGNRLIYRRTLAGNTATVAAEQESGGQDNKVLKEKLLSCPICYEPLIRKGPPGLNLPAVYRSGFWCHKCNKSFTSKDGYLDLTVTSGTTEYTEFKPARTELFRSPLVSFLYERGWRQNFTISGFPGPEEEFNMAQKYLTSVFGGVLVDVSCGSGLFCRKFAASGTYSAVIALDFSENMLRQCNEFITRDTSLLATNLVLVRADVSRLPFASGSVDAVHAGAALHCWPSPSNAIAEISRTLRSGGVFVATTFLATSFNSPSSSRALAPLRIAEISRTLRSGGVFVATTFLATSFNSPFSSRALAPLQLYGQVTNNYAYFTEKEIEDLCKSCGLINYSAKVQRSFIMFSAQRP